jgi:hypothetical protein
LRDRTAAIGHDTAILEAFSGGIGGVWDCPRHSICHPKSLRLIAKSGIVALLDAADWVCIRD